MLLGKPAFPKLHGEKEHGESGNLTGIQKPSECKRLPLTAQGDDKNRRVWGSARVALLDIPFLGGQHS